MRSLKILRSVGIAAVLAVGAADVALAADMPAPPAPMMYAPPPALDVGGGFYLRGDLGVGLYDTRGIDNLPPAPNTFTRSSSLGGTVFMGIGAGYAFNSWLRSDVTLEYRKASKYRIWEETTPPTSGLVQSGYNLTRGKLAAIVGLWNGYIDLGTWNRITPFIGAGVGFAHLRDSDGLDYGYGAFAGGFGRSADKNTTNFAWALHAGLGYDLSTNWKAEVGYRYLNMGTATSGIFTCSVACPPYYSRLKDITAHDLKVGLRYVFADPQVSPMAGPLMRKY